ncbi:MAG: hypothetical protein P1U65_00310 [Minwuia sp.]|nr:hypothetical protein [Minwuia sp.]
MSTHEADPSDPERLARQYVDLWQEQAARVSTDPRLRESWQALTGWLHDRTADQSGAEATDDSIGDSAA